jgi:hypothetical protein
VNRDIEERSLIEDRNRVLTGSRGLAFPTYESYIKSQVTQRQRVLDFGSANHSDETTIIGEKSAHQIVCESNHSVVAVDIVTHGAIRFANSIYLTVNLFDLTKEKQSEALGTIDSIFAGNVIEHLSDPGKLFELAKNLLEVDQKLVLTTVNPVWFIGIWDRLFLSYHSNCIDHTAILGPPEFIELAERYGFKVQEWNLIGKMDMTPRFGMGGRFIGRVTGLLYRAIRRIDASPAYNLIGCVLVKK